MIRGLAAALGLLAATASAGLLARPAGPVLDLTGTLGESNRAELDGICRDLEKTGKGVLVVAIVPTLDGDSIESYAVRLFKEWGIGSKEKNNGVLLLVSTGDRKVRIEVGYGVESLLPDGRCGEIIRHAITPRFKAGDIGGGLATGAREIAAALGGGRPATPAPATEEPVSSIPDGLPPLIMALAFAQVGTGLRRAVRGNRMGLARSAAGLAIGVPAAYLLAQAALPALAIALAVFMTVMGWIIDAAQKNTRGGGWFISSGGGGFGGGSGGSFGGFGGGFSGGGGASGSW